MEWGGPLIQHDWSPYQTREIWTPACTQREHHVKMSAEIGLLQQKPRNAKDSSTPPDARRKAWNTFTLITVIRNQPSRHPDLSLLASRTETINPCLNYPVVLCYSSLSKPTESPSQ